MTTVLRTAVALTAAALTFLGGGVAGAVSPDGDSPKGFYYGTDSSNVTPGGKGPYSEPVIGGAYGGYAGMLGDWANWQGCRRYQLAWSHTDSHDANVDH